MTERTLVAQISIKYYNDGHLEVNAPSDFLLCRHIFNAAERAMIEGIMRTRQQEQNLIQRPGLHSVMDINKH